MPKYDRLSALIAHFALEVRVHPPRGANLIVLDGSALGKPAKVVLSTFGAFGDEFVGCRDVSFSAQAAWGGGENPLLSALPRKIELDISEDQETQLLVQMLRNESEIQRCGSDAVVNRLGEVLMVRLLRLQLQRGPTHSGLLGGLAEPRLSRAIVAVHENPGRNWTIDDLADIAGLSLSRFAELFASIVGETPIAYLRRWRMILARQDIERGDRIKSVAQRYGYRSSEALSRSFRRQFGLTPINARQVAARDT